MTRKPIGISVPHCKVGCVQHDCEKCQRGWVGLSDKMKVILIKNAPNWTTIQLIEEVELLLKERNCG